MKRPPVISRDEWRQLFNSDRPIDRAITAELDSGARFDFVYTSTSSAISEQLRQRLGSEPVEAFRDNRGVDEFARFAAARPDASAATYFLTGAKFDVYAVLVDAEPQVVCVLAHDRPIAPAGT